MAEGKLRSILGNSINSLFLGPSLSSRAFQRLLRAGQLRATPPPSIHHPAWPRSFLSVIHALTGHQGPSAYRLSAPAASPLSLVYGGPGATGMSWGWGREQGCQGTESGHPFPAATTTLWSQHGPFCTPGLSLEPSAWPAPNPCNPGPPGAWSEGARACQGIPQLWKCKPFSPDLGLPRPQLKSQEGNLCCLPSFGLCPQPFQRAQENASDLCAHLDLRPVPSAGTFCQGGNVLDLHSPVGMVIPSP